MRRAISARWARSTNGPTLPNRSSTQPATGYEGSNRPSPRAVAASMRPVTVNPFRRWNVLTA
jgi:hypothetical protein